MKKVNMRSFVSGFIAAALFFAASIPVAAAMAQKSITVSEGVKVYYNDTLIQGADGFIYNGTTYLPVRSVSETLNLPVEWNGTTKSVFLGTHQVNFNPPNSALNAPAAANTLSVEEYKTEIRNLTAAMARLSSVEKDLSSMDASQMPAYIDGIKAPFERAAKLNAPPVYAVAQKKIQTGCNAFINYFDYCKELLSHPEKASENPSRIAILMQVAQTELSEGLSLVLE